MFDFCSLFSLSPAGRSGRIAFLVGTVLVWLGTAIGVELFMEKVPFEHYVAWVTTDDIQVTFVTSLEGYALVAGLLFLFWLLLWGYWMLVIRRLHDIGYHGIASLYLLLPGINALVTLLLCVWPGKNGRNRFGGKDVVREQRGDGIQPAMNESFTKASPAEGVLPDVTSTSTKKSLGWDEFQLPEVDALLKKLEADMVGENLTIRLQLKVRTLEKLRRLVRSGRLTEVAYRRIERHVHAMGN